MSDTLTIEIVNDSEQADSDVYLLLTGNTVTYPSGTTAPTTVTLPQSTTGTATGSALSGLTSTGTLVSPRTGNTCDIYSFQASAIVSGRMLVSFGTGVTYAQNTAPTAEELTFRWDKIEFGYPGSGADLTSMDFFAIPMQFEFLDDSGTVLACRTVYSSTATVLGELSALSTAMAQAFQPASLPPYLANPAATPPSPVPSPFLRVLGPQTVLAANGTPAPYPSFAGYLGTLAASGQSYSVSGTAGVGAPAPQPNAVSYDYSGSFTSDGNGGYVLTLTGTTSAEPYGLYTDADGNTTAQQVPASLTVTLALAADQLDTSIYGCGAQSFSVAPPSPLPSGLPKNWIDYVANSVYATIAGDILAGLHFGYPGGVWGNAGSGWYSNPPTPYPFAAARASNDGYYDAYAAALYNLTDAYGFAYSDRGGRPSPYVPQPANATTLRVTILPDWRLDQPQLSLGDSSGLPDGQLPLSWSAATAPTGFAVTGYQVTATPVAQSSGGIVQTVQLGASATSTTLENLVSGMAYTVTLTVLGTANGNPVSSHPASLTACATGTYSADSGSYTFLITLNWSTGFAVPAGVAITIAGAPCVPQGMPATVTGSAGINLLPMVVTDGTGTVIHQDNYVVELAAGAKTGEYTLTGQPVLLGNSQPLVVSTPGPTYSNKAGQQLVLGTPFAPVAGKLASPVAFPAAS